jgi:hypothetical protein
MFFFIEHLLLSTRWNYRELSGGYQNIATLTVEILKQKTTNGQNKGGDVDTFIIQLGLEL